MPRKKTFQVLREGRKVGAYDDMPMLPDDIQVQLHLSRNDRPQPFHLICERDTLLLVMSGAATVEFKGTSVDRFALKPGDCVYVPSGTPHRIVPSEESIMLRYKAQQPGLEGMAWFCEACDAELHREVWDTATALSQDMFSSLGARFAADPALRTCKSCGAVHPAPDLGTFRWAEAAKEIRAG
jgi:mannose-6-phosphate isomerase-like protein (cupin superfamily)